MLRRVTRKSAGWNQIGMAVVVGVLHDRWTMLRKVAHNEFSDHAAKTGGHQHVFQSRHLLSSKFRVYGLEEVCEIYHGMMHMLEGDTERNPGFGIEIVM
jgi:hypothetical protein